MKKKAIVPVKQEVVKSKPNKNVIAMAAAAGAVLCTAFDARLKVQKYQLGCEKIGNPLRLALLTDLHANSYGKGQKTLVRNIRKQNPDIILLGGNIFSKSKTFDHVETLLKEITPDYPCYFVTGNQEYRSENVADMFATLRAYGVVILSGTSDLINVKGNLVCVAGVTDPDVSLVASSYPNTLEQLDTLKEEADDDSEVFGDNEDEYGENGTNTVDYTILLAHRPEFIEFYLDYNYDLILSGHTNGGQWRIPGLLNGIYASGQGLFPKYAGGEYSYGLQTFIVSRGLDRESTKLPRIFNRPELVIIDVV